MSVVVETTVGDIVIDLYCDERPNCCKNFLKLCKMKYYNYCLFHNIQKDFIAQTGDPTGSGRGGESIYSLAYGEQAKYFEGEQLPKIKHRKLGAVSMINNGEDKHGSQFLITLGENLDYLDGKHTVFGEISKGFDILAILNESITDREGRPYQDIRICHTVVLDDPFEDIKALHYPRKSPEPTDELLKSDRIRCDEEIEALDGKTEEEIKKILEDRETKKRATVLEIIGDIPDADVKPPDNVLFVCKLNQVTNDDDLELIFSRFGNILNCEVIRDRVTGDSLCYAFIEFENKEDCEQAYFKMDNVIIDDRRIHVDFSQSVSKLYWKSRGKDSKPEVYYDYDKNSKSESDNRRYNLKDKYSSHKRENKDYDFVFDNNDDSKVDSKYEKNKKYDQKRPRHDNDEDDRTRRNHHKRDEYRQSSSHSSYDKNGKDDYKRKSYDKKRDRRDRSREKSPIHDKKYHRR